MRIHGIHLQGLRAPRGEHRLQLDPAYNVVFVPDEAAGAGLCQLLRVFLYPSSELGSYALWSDRSLTSPARAGISFSFPSDAYRIILDFDSQRVVLGRYLADSKKFERVSTDPVAIERQLRGEGLPDPAEFAALYDVSLRLAAPPPAEVVAGAPLARLAAERARLERELETAEVLVEARKKLEERRRELRLASERLAPLQTDHDRLVQELEQRSVLAEVMDDLEPRLERVQQLDEERTRERVGIEQERRDLLDERTELRGIPARQDFPLWIGVVLLILGWLAGLLAHPFFYFISGAGALSTGAALLVARAARRRMGGVEANLAALRVRERAVERNFESQSASIRGLMRTLGLGSLEEVAREAADYRGIVVRLRAVNSELEGVRRTLPEGERDELAEIEAQLAELGEVRDPAELRAVLESLPDEAPEAEGSRVSPAPDTAEPALRGDEDLDALIRSAALLAGTTDEEVIEQLGRVLPLYLKLLSGGAFQKARRRDVEGWLLRGEQRGDVIPHSSLPVALRVAVHLAFRLAVLEALSSEYALPLVIGPSLPFSSDEQLEDLARALERLAACTQVIQLSCDKGSWAEHASRQHVLRTGV